jgi:hypothetical protein
MAGIDADILLMVVEHADLPAISALMLTCRVSLLYETVYLRGLRVQLIL